MKQSLNDLQIKHMVCRCKYIVKGYNFSILSSLIMAFMWELWA
jgi:hypothetical protein